MAQGSIQLSSPRRSGASETITGRRGEGAGAIRCETRSGRRMNHETSHQATTRLNFLAGCRAFKHQGKAIRQGEAAIEGNNVSTVTETVMGHINHSA